MQYTDAATFLRLADDHPVFDVRSPSEFRLGHIPGAINLPLFDDEERKKIGTLYKNSGRDASVLLGLDFVGPKMSGFVKQVRRLVPGREILMHCWRGGMRSSGMAWLLEISGFDVVVLEGGYKTYRSHIRINGAKAFQIIVLGGKTGSGKTEILNHLRKEGEQILDLENIAHHKGSAFGHLGQESQPTNEQFENDLFASLHKMKPGKPVWIEDESRSIGTVSMPDPFIRQMKASPLIIVDVGKELRIERLIREYSGFDPSLLENSVQKISQRLGGLNTKKVIEALVNKNFNEASDLLLVYYDKLYLAGMQSRQHDQIFTIPLDSGDPENNASAVLKFYRQNFDAIVNQNQFDNSVHELTSLVHELHQLHESTDSPSSTNSTISTISTNSTIKQ